MRLTDYAALFEAEHAKRYQNHFLTPKMWYICRVKEAIQIHIHTIRLHPNDINGDS